MVQLGLKRSNLRSHAGERGCLLVESDQRMVDLQEIQFIDFIDLDYQLPFGSRILGCSLLVRVMLGFSAFVGN